MFNSGDLYVTTTNIWMSPASMPTSPELLISINKKSILMFLQYTGHSYVGGGLEKMFLCLNKNKIVYDCETTSRQAYRWFKKF